MTWRWVIRRRDARGRLALVAVPPEPRASRAASAPRARRDDRGVWTDYYRRKRAAGWRKVRGRWQSEGGAP